MALNSSTRSSLMVSGLYHGPHGRGGFDHLPSFDSQNSHVDRAGFGGVAGGEGRRRYEIAIDTFDPEPMVPDRLQVFSPGNEDHLLSGLGQSSAQLAADASGADNRNSHSALSVSARVKPGST